MKSRRTLAHQVAKRMLAVAIVIAKIVMLKVVQAHQDLYLKRLGTCFLEQVMLHDACRGKKTVRQRLVMIKQEAASTNSIARDPLHKEMLLERHASMVRTMWLHVGPHRQRNPNDY